MNQSFNYAKENNLDTTNNMCIIYGNNNIEICEQIQPVYENMKQDIQSNQNRLLRKLFRNAGNTDAIYENLCRGCGYGVFEAKSDLCHFCSCVVKGLQNNQLHKMENSQKPYQKVDQNIYENVCFKCSALYNTDECESCLAANENTIIFDEKKETPQLKNTPPIKVQTPTKLQKSKSFHKFDKQNIINGIFGSLKRGVIARKHSTNRHHDESKKQKKLDIVHHVDGYKNIFRTNETFDLQRICELKKAQTAKFKVTVSTSDQHIYGRLKMNGSKESCISSDENTQIYLSKSHDQLQATNLDYMPLSHTDNTSIISDSRKTLTDTRKRARISKPSFLCSRPKIITDNKLQQSNNIKLALPLCDSVCYWMKLLRKEVYNYNSNGAANDDDEQYALCIPKSIPSKSVLMNTYKPVGCNLNNCDLKAFSTNLNETMTNISVADKKGDFEIPILSNNTNLKANSNYEIVNEPMEKHFIVMVDMFKQNILTKHMLYQQREHVPAVKNFNLLISIPSTGDHSIRSVHKPTKDQEINYANHDEYIENNISLDYAREHRNQNSVTLNGSCKQQALSTIDVENYLTSCYSAFNVNEVKSDHCGYTVNVGDVAPHASADSEFQRLLVASLKKCKKKKTKRKRTKTKKIRNTETVDSYKNVVATVIKEKVNENKYIKERINYLTNATDSNIESTYALEETNDECISNSTIQQVFASKPNTIITICNVLHLINIIQISSSLNTIVLISCSNRSQYIDWFQDWLLCHYNPWSFKAKCALKVLAYYNTIDKAWKICTLLNESVKHRNYIWECVECEERAYWITQKPTSDLNAHNFISYHRMTLQNERQNNVTIFERKNEKLTVSILNGKNTPMKTNDEVILRPKSKESLERSAKAHGQFLDYDENLVELDENSSKLNESKNAETFVNNVKSCNDKSESKTNLTPSNETQSNLHTLNDSQNVSYIQELSTQEEEEDIYQPIWEFKTVGVVKEHYDSDPESCDTKCLIQKQPSKSYHQSSIPSLVISDNAEDQGEWETDDEFMFTKKFQESFNLEDTISSHSTISIDNSTTDIGSSTNSNFHHPLFRTVCIYFSLSEPKIRAIVYDYDRTHATRYFRKNTCITSLNQTNERMFQNQLSSQLDSSPIRDNSKTAGPSSTNLIKSGSGEVLSSCNSNPVQLWKLGLLNSSQVEDEEDMFVLESEILRSQLFKEEPETENSIPPSKTATLQRFKSASFGNLLDIPREDDKKSITERMRNKLQRGVFKLNMRSPKSEKKRNGIFRSVKTGSLYLEDGMRPKFPIFGAPLDQLEMHESLHHQVPRFVVDCVSYIERKDCIAQDGLYRASGNKLAIDELKHKLTESYIYDSKLLITDDIHTVTSLLKQFFRELLTPLIPQFVYDQIGSEVLDGVHIEPLRNTLEMISDPNRSTLKFLIRHLKNVAAFSRENRMPASNLAIVWGPCIFSANQLPFVDIGRMNTLTKLLIENYEYIFRENERLVN